jgi:hypothetical protein
MSAPLIFVRDGRTLPFVPVTTAALRAIREACPQRRPYAVATYMALLELANEERAQRVAVTQRTIVERVGASRSTVQRALSDLADAGVVEVVERVHAGARVENEYVVVEPAISDTPASDTGGGRPQGTQLTQDVLQEGPSAKASGSGESARATANNEVPEDFPDELRPHARAVMRVLLSVAEHHNAEKPSVRALAHVIMARPHHPLVEAAHDFAAWAMTASRRKNVVSGYRNWLAKTSELAGVERLPGEAGPAPPSNVSRLRRRTTAADDVDDRVRSLRAEAERVRPPAAQ